MIKTFYQQCDPAKPLGFNDERRVFPPDGTRGEGDLIAQVMNAIRWSDVPLHLLFAGHRGAGKSTELLRLCHDLKNPPKGEKPFFVVYFEADDEDIDVNDTDLPDVLLAMVRQVGKTLRDGAGIELKPSWFSNFFDSLKSLLGSEVRFEEVEFDAKIAKFTAAIKDSPDARQKIRAALEPNVSNLLKEANNLFDEAVIELKKKGYANLVLVVDNLDRIVLRDVPGSQFNTHEQLFINRAAQLAALNCHVVYTVPISMVFSPRGTALTTVFGAKPYVLPMVKVADRKGKDAAGLEVMRDIIRKRLAPAGADENDAFDSAETLDYFCRMSGGHLRNLLILLRSAATSEGKFPLTRTAAERAARGMGTDFERALNHPAFFDALKAVVDTARLPGSDHDQLLLYNLSILEYVNAAAWYAVNPAVLLLDKFMQPKASRPAAAKKKPNRS